MGAVSGVSLSAIPAEPFDVVLNATSGSTLGETLDLPSHVLNARVFACDMAYGTTAKAFVALAAAKGARASDGLGMLVEQAAESFALWRGRRPATGALIADLRARL